jgi:hypothetical protein
MTLENFVTKDSLNTNLYVEVKFNFDYVARTWVIKEKEDTWEKTIILDSEPGEGIITFSPLDKTIVYKNLNRIVVKTYLDLQKIDDVDAFLEKFKIQYNLLEDDDLATLFQNSEIYFSDSDQETVFNDAKTNVMFTKVIKIV